MELRAKKSSMATRGMLAVGLLSGIYVVYIYLINSFVPYYSDDVFYRYIHMYDLTSPVQSVGDVVRSQCEHWQQVNGRSIIHGLLQLLLLLSPGKVLFNVLNAVVWVLLAWLIAKVALPGRRLSPVALLVAIVGLQYFLPGNGYLYWWASGSLNYVWTSVIMLLYVYIYMQYFNAHDSPVPPAQGVLLVLLSAVVGWTHEAAVVGLWAAMATDMFIHYRRRQARQPVVWYMLGGLTAGLLLMAFAPGNLGKLMSMEEHSRNHVLQILYVLSELHVSWLAVAVLLWGMWRRREATCRFVRQRLPLVVMWAVDVAFCCLLGMADRAVFFAELVAWIVLMAYAAGLWAGVRAPWRTVCCAAVAVLLLAADVVQYTDTRRVYAEVDAARERMAAATCGYAVINDVEPLMPQALSSVEFIKRVVTAEKDERYLPATVYDAVVSGRLFDASNRLRGGLPFYTTDSLPCVVMPCDTVPVGGRYVYRYEPASVADPHLSLTGRLRRMIAPATLPAYGDAPDGYGADATQPYVIAGKKYIVLEKPYYQRVAAVEWVPDEV